MATLANEKLELIHLRAIIGVMQDAGALTPMPDFKTWVADMSNHYWRFDEKRGRWYTHVDAGDGAYTVEFLTVEEAIGLYADGETPNER